jgi:hypothetical protein
MVFHVEEAVVKIKALNIGFLSVGQDDSSASARPAGRKQNFLFKRKESN